MGHLSFIWTRYLVNVLDVALVTFTVYQFLVLIRGTRAVQIVVGIAIVAAITVIARFLELPSLTWLLGKIWIAGVVLMAVLFQPEIRSGLARLGARTALRFVPTRELSVVNELVGAIREASRRQMGMLLVIERDEGLKNYLESGTLIGGDLTRELLLSIFQPPGVLHDGAIIIQGDRVAAAGVILPLSEDEHLSKLLGTRHRAAVGITEVSDAWAICVSEETGTISIADDGKLTSNVDADQLRQHLLQSLQVSSISENDQPPA